MKLVKYISLCLLAVLAWSCQDKDVEFKFHKVDESKVAYVQIYNCPPLKAVTANYAYYLTLNGIEYGNNGSVFLRTYNFVPSGAVAKYYTVPAGDLTLTLLNSKKEQLYNQMVSGLEAGKHYILFIYNYNEAPKVFEDLEIPKFPGTAETAKHCSMRFFNFLYEEDGTPFADKLQYALRYKNEETGENEYEMIGEPVGFGEGTSYFTPEINKTVFNSSGYETRYITIYRIDAQTGENLGQLQYINSKGKEVAFTDYWTWYIGRAYHEVMGGIRTSSSITMTLAQYTAL